MRARIAWRRCSALSRTDIPQPDQPAGRFYTDQIERMDVSGLSPELTLQLAALVKRYDAWTLKRFAEPKRHGNDIRPGTLSPFLHALEEESCSIRHSAQVIEEKDHK